MDAAADTARMPEVLEAIATTRAIRRYRLDEPIPEADLAAILFAATRAPTGSNRQSFRFVVLRDSQRAREAKALLGEAFRRGWRAKRTEDGYDRTRPDDTGSADDSPRARMARTMEHFVANFERIPVVVLACLIRYRAPNPTEGGSVYPACQNLLLAARALGYGGVLTMWHAPVEDQLRRLLGLPEELFVAATIPLGRPAGRHGPVRRRPLHELVYEDHWGEPAAWAQEPEGLPAR